MRVITGIAKGRKLKVMEGLVTRPTSDRVKEALFNIISKKVVDANILDLFAGSGALGIECISRGSLSCTFVEHNKNAFNIIKENLKNLNFEKSSKLINQDAFDALKQLSRNADKFHLIFLDPPYGKGIVEKSIAYIIKHNLLDEDGIIISEYDEKDLIPPSIGEYKIYRTEKYGRTKISFWSRSE